VETILNNVAGLSDCWPGMGNGITRDCCTDLFVVSKFVFSFLYYFSSVQNGMLRYRDHNALTSRALISSSGNFSYFSFKFDIRFQRLVGRLPLTFVWCSEVAVVSCSFDPSTLH